MEIPNRPDGEPRRDAWSSAGASGAPRCPECSATLRTGDQWCSLCFHELPASRAERSAAAAPASTVPGPRAGSDATEPEPATQAPIPPSPIQQSPIPQSPIQQSQVAQYAGTPGSSPGRAAAAAGWPCQQCTTASGAATFNAFERDTCARCGGAFLRGAASPVGPAAPGYPSSDPSGGALDRMLGQARRMTSARRMLLGAGVALAVAVLLPLLLALLGR